jgi:hypothetical protein
MSIYYKIGKDMDIPKSVVNTVICWIDTNELNNYIYSTSQKRKKLV